MVVRPNPRYYSPMHMHKKSSILKTLIPNFYLTSNLLEAKSEQKSFKYVDFSIFKYRFFRFKFEFKLHKSGINLVFLSKN